MDQFEAAVGPKMAYLVSHLVKYRHHVTHMRNREYWVEHLALLAMLVACIPKAMSAVGGYEMLYIVTDLMQRARQARTSTNCLFSPQLNQRAR